MTEILSEVGQGATILAIVGAIVGAIVSRLQTIATFAAAPLLPAKKRMGESGQLWLTGPLEGRK